MREPSKWYDANATDNPPWIKALAEVRHRDDRPNRAPRSRCRLSIPPFAAPMANDRALAQVRAPSRRSPRIINIAGFARRRCRCAGSACRWCCNCRAACSLGTSRRQRDPGSHRPAPDGCSGSSPRLAHRRLRAARLMRELASSFSGSSLGFVCPHHRSPQIPDSPGGFLESWRASLFQICCPRLRDASTTEMRNVALRLLPCVYFWSLRDE
jgi:hypothetical protein